MKFKGKIAPWWYIVTVLFNIIIIWLFVSTKMGVSAQMMIPLWITFNLYFVPVFFCNYVTIDKQNVVIKFGLLKKTLPTQEIISVKAARVASASFSASFDRLELEPRRMQNVYISVVDKKAFLQEIQRINRKVKYLIG